MKKILFTSVIVCLVGISNMYAQSSKTVSGNAPTTSAVAVSKDTPAPDAAGNTPAPTAVAKEGSTKACCMHGTASGKSCCSKSASAKKDCKHGNSEKAEVKTDKATKTE
jgi:hypothetical protein